MGKEQILDEQHWKFKDYRQRIEAKQWKELLLNDDDNVIFEGKVYRLLGKSLGAGVFEVYKQRKSMAVGYKCKYGGHEIHDKSIPCERFEEGN